jgi:osmotically-inducible protein OsmY
MRKTVFCVVLLSALAGCSRPGQPEAVEEGKDAKGNPTIHVNGEQVERNLDQAGQDLKQAGREMKEGAQEAGQAIQEGAEKMDEKYGPAAREMLGDAAITARIKAKLMADPEIKSLHIDVDTVDGRVALNGKVSSADQRAEAEKLASHTDGVRSIVNLIQVAGQETPPPQPPHP